MDYEKLHKDTIAKLQEMVNSKKITVEIARGICADFVPESEDERIRKEIRNFISWAIDRGSITKEQREKTDSWFAWLEKQRENNMGISEATKQKLEDNLNKALEKETPESWNKFLDEQGEDEVIERMRKCPDPCLKATCAGCPNFNNETWAEKIKDMDKLEEYLFALNPERSKEVVKIDAKNIRHILSKEALQCTEDQLKALRVVINFAADNPSMRWNNWIYNSLKSLKEKLEEA